MPAHYERVLRHGENLPEEAVQAFFRVYDLYLADDGAGFDRMVEERGRGLDEEFAEPENGCGGSGGNGDGGGGTSTGADADGEERFSQGSWNRFFYELHGREGLGYDVDKDGCPIDEEYRDEGRE